MGGKSLKTVSDGTERMQHRPERSGLGRREGISGRSLAVNRWCAIRPVQGARRIIAVQLVVSAESGRANGPFRVGRGR
ncbi:hypothetical protein CSW63_18870 [Caulobacter sp. FWC26]|nr:hypothetical protein CSW63_18870 [Caulobacter sp. FWC26]